MRGARINGLDGRSQSGTTVGDHQQQFVALQAVPVEIVEQRFPVGLTLAFGAQKAEQLPGSILAHAVGHQHLHTLPPRGPAHLQADPVQEQVGPFVLQRRAMKLPHGMVQIASQVGDRLRADRLARQRSHHAAHLAGRDTAQKGLADQQGQLRSPALELLHPRRKKALAAGAGNAQPNGAEAGHEVPLVVTVAIAARRPLAALVAVEDRKPVPHALRFSLQKLLPSQLGLRLQVAPEALLQVSQKVLELFADRYNLSHGCKAPLKVGL